MGKTNVKRKEGNCNLHGLPPTTLSSRYVSYHSITDYPHIPDILAVKQNVIVEGEQKSVSRSAVLLKLGMFCGI